MSVIGTYVRIDDGALVALRRDPEWLTQLTRGRVPGASIIDVDKACDAIVWLLDRVPPSAAPPIEGAGFTIRRSLTPYLCGARGEELAELEAGYGPATLVPAPIVRELSVWLRDIELDAVRQVYDPKAMAQADVYPNIWMRDRAAALEEYVIPHLQRLRAFIAEAAEQQQNLMVCFT